MGRQLRPGSWAVLPCMPHFGLLWTHAVQLEKHLFLHHALCAPAACSSSFLALHDACVDLQRGRIDYAMVGGASALLRPATTVAFNQLQ